MREIVERERAELIFRKALADGSASFRLRRYDSAVAHLERALGYVRATTTSSQEADFFSLFGRALMRSGRNALGVEMLVQALASRPDDHYVMYKLSIGLARLKRSSDALESIDRAISLNDRQAAYFCQRATILKRIGRIDEARDALESSLKIDPTFEGSLQELKSL